eukprot:jgi/Bigna1/76477/fgenesh1_pg.41_\
MSNRDQCFNVSMLSIRALLSQLLERMGSPSPASSFANPLEFIVEGLAKAYYPLGCLRFLVFLIYTLVCWETLYGRLQVFSMRDLKRVLLFHHTMAATGSRVVPASSSLPSRNWLVWPLYIAFLYTAVTSLLSDEDAGSKHGLQLCIVLFIACSVMDLGLFYSTRPGDILRLLAASAFLPESSAARTVYTLSATLYFWSGVSKFGGWFRNWTFPYQFLVFSPFSYPLRSWYLHPDKRPRMWGSLFGLGGVVGEMLIGLGMLTPNAVVQRLSLAASVAMHAFICICGMGPYRWNLMQVYVNLCSTALCLGQVQLTSCYCSDERVGVLQIKVDLAPEIMTHSFASSHHARKVDEAVDISVMGALSFAYVGVLGVLVPLIGSFSTTLLGRYLGGYRMANFHFAGNEVHTLLLLPTDRLLPGVAKGIDGTSEVMAFPWGADGMDVRAIVRPWLKTHTPIRLGTAISKLEILNTKWDESLVSIRDAYLRIICEEYFQPGAREGGDPVSLVVLTAGTVPFWCGGRGKPFDLTEITYSVASGRGIKVKSLREGTRPLPWAKLYKDLADWNEDGG